MFGTLRYDFQGIDHNSSEKSSQKNTYGAQSNGDQSFACERCYSKKLKCNRRKNGCDRCLSTTNKCVYLATGNRGGTRRRRHTESQNGMGADKKPRTTPPPLSIITSANASMESMAQPLPDTNSVGDVKALATSNTQPEEFLNFWESAIPHELNSSSNATDEVMDDFSTQSMFYDIPTPDFGISLDFDGCNAKKSSTDSLSSSSKDLGFWVGLPAAGIIHKDSTTGMSEKASTWPQVKGQPSQLPRQNGAKSALSSSSGSVSSPPCQALIHLTSSSVLPCLCLQTAASMLENLETKSSLLGVANIDWIMALHQQTLAQCDQLLTCQQCEDRSERMMLLTMIFEKLVGLCENAVSKWVQCSQDKNLRHQEIGAEGFLQHFSFGGYEVNHQDELESLTKILIILRLKALSVFLDKLKGIASAADRRTQLLMLQTSQRRAEETLQALHNAEHWLSLGITSNLFSPE